LSIQRKGVRGAVGMPARIDSTARIRADRCMARA
jgi:hypothetical protein